jgi:ABC-type multidrug transport system fused ATPase/permease subunit
MNWNSKPFIAVACVASLFVGASQPIFGGFLMSPVLTQLSVDLDLYAILFPGLDLETEMGIYCAWMGVFAVVTFISMFVQKYFFNRLSEEVTYQMRFSLYNAILSKNIGWFDLRENSVGVLTSSMA